MTLPWAPLASAPARSCALPLRCSPPRRRRRQRLARPTTRAVFDAVDAQLEAGRHADAPFTLAEWRHHRSAARHWAALASTPRSHVFRAAAPPAAVGTVLCAALGAYDTLRADTWPAPPHVSLGLLSLTAGTLSLLIVFRTNSSYARFDEARRLWGVLVNRSRDLNRSVAAGAAPASRGVARWCAALAHCTRLLVSQDAPWTAPPAELAALLSAQEAAALAAAQHRPLFCLQVLTQLVAAGGADAASRRSCDEDLRALEDAVGGCERLLRTPLPLSYTKLTSRFLALWLLLTPFALWNDMRWEAVLFTPLFTFLLYGLDEVAIELEEPQSILPLRLFCDKIAAEGAGLRAAADDVNRLVAAELATAARADGR